MLNQETIEKLYNKAFSIQNLGIAKNVEENNLIVDILQAILCDNEIDIDLYLECVDGKSIEKYNDSSRYCIWNQQQLI